jgi:hypothetical protein
MLVHPTFRKPEPLIMQLDCSSLNFFQVSPSDFSSTIQEESDDESLSEDDMSSVCVSGVYIIKESGSQTYPQAKKRKPLPRCNSWSFSLTN